MRAPEEQFGDGTSRMELITADLNLNVPWSIKNTAINFNSAVHAQWNKTRLTAQDKIAIGGRSTVRGFDGEMSLSAERGFYVRNDLSISYLPNQSIYLALDAGHVSGPSTQWLLGQTLVGAAIGLKGQFKAGGNLQYDVFVGMPVKKPNGFNTRHTTYGFNLNYSF
jgi:hemolysin activation/secretion protein